MLPLRDVIPSHSTPYITLTIIALTTAVWLAELSLPLASAADNFSRFGIVPARVTGWSLLTAPFLHASWIQVVCNMWSLWVFGENVEGRVGPVGFGVFYLLSSAVATLAYVLADPSSSLLVVGSSGAVAGVLGGYVVLYPGSRVLTLIPRVFGWDVVEVPSTALLGVWGLLQFVGGSVWLPTAHTHDPALAFATYLTAFLVGAAGLSITGHRRTPPEWWATSSDRRSTSST